MWLWIDTQADRRSNNTDHSFKAIENTNKKELKNSVATMCFVFDHQIYG